MNAWNVALSGEYLEELNLRAKSVLATLQLVSTLTYERKSVSEIARRLECTRDKVIWMQHVLRWRTGGAGAGLGKWPREARR